MVTLTTMGIFFHSTPSNFIGNIRFVHFREYSSITYFWEFFFHLLRARSCFPTLSLSLHGFHMDFWADGKCLFPALIGFELCIIFFDLVFFFFFIL